MKEIIHITMDSAENNKDITYKILNKDIRVKILGVDFNVELIKGLLKEFRGSADAITIAGLPNSIQINGTEYSHPLLSEFREIAYPTPVLDGTELRRILIPWALNKFLKKEPNLFKNKEVSFFSGFVQHYMIEELKSHDVKFRFADIYFATGIPLLIKSPKSLNKFIEKTIHFFTSRSITKYNSCDFDTPILKKTPVFKEFYDSDIYILNSTQLSYINLPDLNGKTVIVENLTESAREILKEKNVGRIYQCSANFEIEHFSTMTELEALFQVLKDENTPLTQKEMISYIEELQLTPKAEVLNNDITTPNKFAFVIHPLSSKDLFKIPGSKLLQKSKFIRDNIERVSSTLPSFHYGQIKGIKSEHDGTMAIGDIYAVTETPKVMMSKSKKKMYQKLIDITKKADQRGNQIIGLGAYTKVFGDAGVTVNKHSPIPVTTGNSLSAAATLWAAAYAVDKLNFVEIKKKKYLGTVMIVGATGSIGKVNSKVLSRSWEKVIIVAPKAYKLIDLKKEIEELSPDCDISYTTNPDDFLHEADLVITTTSAQGKKILDIEKVKPGCVICDVSRPFDISQEDARKRPDVLVIASGEVELPGDVEFNIDIGLQGKTVYACLAETALLAMENLFESFSMSREISYKNVYKIDELARKHGLKLSSIMGHKSEITDEEIELCKEHALKKRA